MSEATKKNSWVDKDLRKSNKKKCFEENRAVQNAKKNKTTKKLGGRRVKQITYVKRKRH